MRTMVKDFTAYGQSFVVVKNDEGFYLAINKKYIDADGKLTRQLNGIQMHANKNLNDCLNSTMDACKIDYYVSQGMSREEAFQKWYTELELQVQA